MFFRFRLLRLEWDKFRRNRAIWALVGLLWIFGILPIVFSYHGSSTPPTGLPTGMAPNVTAGLLFTGILICGVIGAVLADIDTESNTRLLLLTSGTPRPRILTTKLGVAVIIAVGTLGGQLFLDILMAEANALFAFHRLMAIVWPTWALLVSILGLMVTFLWIGFAARSVSHSLLVGAGVPVVILFGERYLGPNGAVFLGWLPNFSLSNVLFLHPLNSCIP